jgi:hypothetical protein
MITDNVIGQLTSSNLCGQAHMSQITRLSLISYKLYSLIIIIRLMQSESLHPKVITLSDIYCSLLPLCSFYCVRSQSQNLIRQNFLEWIPTREDFLYDILVSLNEIFSSDHYQNVCLNGIRWSQIQSFKLEWSSFLIKIELIFVNLAN